MIEGGHLSDPQSLRGGDHRCVHCAKLEVAVPGDEFGDTEPVATGHRLDKKVSRGEIAKKKNLGDNMESGPDQIGHLSDHQVWNHQRTRMSPEEVQGFLVVPVIGVDIGVERTSIDDDGYRATSAASISSMRSEMSSRPLLPAPAALNFRARPPRWVSMASRVRSEMVTPRRSASCRSKASRSSGSLTVVRCMICQHTLTTGGRVKSVANPGFPAQPSAVEPQKFGWERRHLSHHGPDRATSQAKLFEAGLVAVVERVENRNTVERSEVPVVGPDPIDAMLLHQGDQVCIPYERSPWGHHLCNALEARPESGALPVFE